MECHRHHRDHTGTSIFTATFSFNTETSVSISFSILDSPGSYSVLTEPNGAQYLSNILDLESVLIQCSYHLLFTIELHLQ